MNVVNVRVLETSSRNDVTVGDVLLSKQKNEEECTWAITMALHWSTWAITIEFFVYHQYI